MKALRNLVLASASMALISTIALADTFNFNQVGFHNFTVDFDRYATAEWTITKTGAGTNALTTIDGGALLVTNAAASGDNVFHQLTTETFSWDSTKRLYCSARFKVDSASPAVWAIGLQVTDTTPLAVSDGIWFDKAASSTAVAFHVAKTSVQTDAAAIATQADNTFNVYEFYYDGSVMRYYVDGVALGTVASTNIPTRTLTVSFALQNGTAVARNMTVDYMQCSKER